LYEAKINSSLDTSRSEVVESINFFYSFLDILWSAARIYENTCFSIDDALTESAIIDAYHRGTTGHRFDRTHTEVFIHRNVDCCFCPTNQVSEFGIGRRFSHADIVVSFNHGLYL
jgi:hypothetical protein